MMQDHAAGVGPFCLGQIASTAETVGRPADVQGAKAVVQGDAFGPDRGEKTVERQAESRGVVLEAEIVVAGLRI